MRRLAISTFAALALAPAALAQLPSAKVTDLGGGIQVIFASFVVSLIDDELPARSPQGPPDDG